MSYCYLVVKLKLQIGFGDLQYIKGWTTLDHLFLSEG